MVAGFTSAEVGFDDNVNSMPELRLDLADFLVGAGTGFSLASVTGIEIYLEKTGPAPGAAETITIMAIRAVHTDWVESHLDFDTRWGVLHIPPTLGGAVYAGAVAEDFEFIRGNGTPDDPFPVDGSYTIFFYPGGSTSPTDMTGANPGRLAVILRETKVSGDDDGSAIIATLSWDDAEIGFSVERRDTDAGVTSSTTPVADTVSENPIDPGLLYAWTVKLIGKSLDSTLQVVNRRKEVQSLIWRLATENSDDWTFRNGRIGFMADLANRDAYVEALVQAPVGYAHLLTRVYETRNPIDGVRLQAIFAPDADLFSELTGADAFRDQTKTLSGAGSIRTATGVETNQFIVDDWYETYLEASIWVPATVTSANQPVILLNAASASYPLPAPDLQPAQWNVLRFELRQFEYLITGLAYSVSFEPGPLPDSPLGYFWVDSVKVGRRKVAWAARATEGGPFRRFYRFVNDPRGAVHFNPDERGRALQLRADALTPDAWVSEFTLFPRYAELGMPVYDKGFETR